MEYSTPGTCGNSGVRRRRGAGPASSLLLRASLLAKFDRGGALTLPRWGIQ